MLPSTHHLLIVVPPSNIELSEILHIMEPVYELRDEGDWVLILNCYCIQGLVVLHQSQGAVLLFDKEDWRGHGGLEWPNVS